MSKIEYKYETNEFVESLIKEMDDYYMNEKTKWGYALDKHEDAFLLGINTNIGKHSNKKFYGYICIYLGFWTLSIGKDFWD